jgi:hypothetical protein
MQIRLKKNNKVYEAKLDTGAYYHPYHGNSEPLYTWNHLPYIHDAEENWVKLCSKHEYEVLND